jgi:DNA-binding NtrC family response regulator
MNSTYDESEDCAPSGKDLPDGDVKGHRGSPTGRQAIPRGSGQKILVVDDEELLLEMVGDMLGHYSYVPILTNSGETAIEALKREKGEVELVILDLSMPGMGGHRCLEEMLRIEPNLKVIIASGYSAGKKLKETLNSGAAGFLAKPYHHYEIMAKISKFLGVKGAEPSEA